MISYLLICLFISLLSPCAVFVLQDEPLPPVTAEEEQEAPCSTWIAIASFSHKSVAEKPLRRSAYATFKARSCHVTKSWR